MKVFNKITGSDQDHKDLMLLLVIGGLYALSIALSNTFVNVYLWKQTGEFKDIAFYNLAAVIMQPIVFIFAGRWAKKMDRVILLRLGVTFLSTFYIFVLFIGEQAADFLLLLGGLLGVGNGFYWLAYNVLTFEITEPETRDFFNGFAGNLTSFAGMIGPILAGLIISKLPNFTGYTVIFTISFGLFVAAVVLSIFLRKRKAHGRFYFFRILHEKTNNQNWRRILHAHFVQGLREGSFIFIIPMWVFITTNSELALGTFGLVNSGVAFIFYFLAPKVIKPKLRKKAILLGGTTLFVATFLLFFNLTFSKLIIYGVIIAMAYPVVLVPYFSLTFDVIGKAWKAAQMRVEYIVVREVYLNAGRITSIVLFLVVITIFNQTKSLPILMAFIGSGHMLIYFFIRHIDVHRKGRTNNDNKQPSVFKRNLADGEGGSTI